MANIDLTVFDNITTASGGQVWFDSPVRVVESRTAQFSGLTQTTSRADTPTLAEAASYSAIFGRPISVTEHVSLALVLDLETLRTGRTESTTLVERGTVLFEGTITVHEALALQLVPLMALVADSLTLVESHGSGTDPYSFLSGDTAVVSEFISPHLASVSQVAIATFQLQAELDGPGNGWTDLSGDVNIGINPVSVEYGITGGGPLDRIGDVGTLSWSMNNAQNNSAGLLGYYTPGHANCRAGWELGIAVRLAVIYGGMTYYKFRGTLSEVEPDPGTYRRRTVTCVAYDWMDEALMSLFKATDVQTMKRSDQLIDMVIENCTTRKPAAKQINVGQSTFSFAFDNLRDEGDPAIRAMSDITIAELGYLYIKGDTVQGGTLAFEDRHARPLADTKATFTGTMFDIVAQRKREDILNRVGVTVHPREVDPVATTVVYELTQTDTKPFLFPGENIALTVFFRSDAGRFVRIGATDVVTPVADTDYRAHTRSDGTGVEVTDAITLAFTSTSNSATLLLTNTHATHSVYITKLQVRAKAVQDRYDLSAFDENSTSKTKYGERDLIYDMVCEDRVDIAKNASAWFVNLFGDARTVLNELVIHGNRSPFLMTHACAREPGDQIAVSEDMTGISGVKYFINGVRMTLSRGGIVTCSWVLAPSDQSKAWVLEDPVYGILETTTVLGFV